MGYLARRFREPSSWQDLGWLFVILAWSDLLGTWAHGPLLGIAAASFLVGILIPERR